MYVMHVVYVVGEGIYGELVEPCRNSASPGGSNIGWDFTEMSGKVLLNSVLVLSGHVKSAPQCYNLKHKWFG